MFGGWEMGVRLSGEVRKSYRHHLVVCLDEAEPRLQFGSTCIFGLEIPFSFFSPAETDAAERNGGLAACLVEHHGLPFGVVLLAEPVGEVASAKETAGDVMFPLFLEPHEVGHVGVAPGVVAEILALARKMELFEDHVSHGQRQGGIGTLFCRQP